MRIRCTILLPDGFGDVAGYTLGLTIEDVTILDRAAAVVAIRRLPSAMVPRHGQRLGPIEFDVLAPLDPDREYNLRAILTKCRNLTAGDLLSTERYGVPAGLPEITMEVRLHVVH